MRFHGFRVYMNVHILRGKLILDIPLETAVIFFSSDSLSKIGYWLGVCHG